MIFNRKKWQLIYKFFISQLFKIIYGNVIFSNKNDNDVKFNNAVIDKDSLKLLNGSIVDFKSQMIGESFVIENPKAKSSCGCGLSFSA